MYQIVLLIIWMIAILVMTSISSLKMLGNKIEVSFVLVAKPDIGDLFTPMQTFEGEFLYQKLGHVLVFFFLALLSARIAGALKVVIFCGSFAVVTELLQLFLSRGGRLYDIGFNLAGVFLAITITLFLRWTFSSGKPQDV